MSQPTQATAIAGRLKISIRTERNHVARILIKLGVHTELQVRRFRAVRVRSVEDGWALDGAERFRPQDTLAVNSSGG